MPGGQFRVHPEHHIPSRDQRTNPRPPIGLDPDHHLARPVVIGQELRDQFVQFHHPRDALCDPFTGQHPALIVLDLQIMMVFGPVVTNEQHNESPVTPA